MTEKTTKLIDLASEDAGEFMLLGALALPHVRSLMLSPPSMRFNLLVLIAAETLLQSTPRPPKTHSQLVREFAESVVATMEKNLELLAAEAAKDQANG